MGETQLVTSALSLARELYRYGEPDLAERAFRLSPEEVAAVGRRIAQMYESGEAARLWPDGPKNRAYLLAVIEAIEGHPRPSSRARRLPEKALPQHLQATEEQRWQAASEVAAVVDARRRQP